MNCADTHVGRAHGVARRCRAVVSGLVVAGLVLCAHAAHSQQTAEYRLKAAFLYNFALFTEWPDDASGPLNLCIYGTDPFGPEIDALQGKRVGERLLTVRRTGVGKSLSGCDIVFITPSAISGLPSVLEGLRGRSVLTVADEPGAAQRGVALNMAVGQNKVTFEANLLAARNAGITLSSKLLRLATEVIQ